MSELMDKGGARPVVKKQRTIVNKQNDNIISSPLQQNIESTKTLQLKKKAHIKMLKNTGRQSTNKIKLLQKPQNNSP